MLFKGRLRLPSDPGEGIPIDLELEDVYLSLDSAGEDFGEWRLDTVEIKRLFSNQFSMLLDGEAMVFIADDALGFAYDGLSTIEDVKSRLSKRRVFKGRKPKKRTGAVTEIDDEPEETEIETPAQPKIPDVPMPEVVPFFPETSPSFADSVAESATEDDSIAPVSARPIEPMPSGDVEPATEPERPPVAPAVDQPAPEEQPAVAQPAAPPPAARPEAAPPPEEDLPTDDDDDFVIEEVAAYGYIPNLASAVPREPVVEARWDAESLEIEEADVATGAVHREAHPLGEREPAQPTSEVHPLGEPGVPEPEPRPAPESTVPESTVPESTVPESTEQPGPDPEPTFAPTAPAAPSGDQPFGQWSSNGRATPEPEPEAPSEETDRPQTQKTGRHQRSTGRSRSLFGRKKSREPEEHDHRYESSKTVGGITRSVCSVCDHVSFAGEDVYQDW